MYSLSKIDPMKIDPEQIRVAIRVDESVNATRGSAQITMGYKVEDSDIHEEHQFDVQLINAQTLTPKLTRGMQPGERVTVMSLKPEDAHTMRDFQQRLYQYKAAGIEGDGSFSLRLKDLCLDYALTDRDIPLTLFLYSESYEDFIVFINTELHDLFSDTDSDIGEVAFCEEIAAGRASYRGVPKHSCITKKCQNIPVKSQVYVSGS
jgi:hypothetical protein